MAKWVAAFLVLFLSVVHRSKVLTIRVYRIWLVRLLRRMSQAMTKVFLRRLFVQPVGPAQTTRLIRVHGSMGTTEKMGHMSQVTPGVDTTILHRSPIRLVLALVRLPA